ncbi:hypothetical protein GCM10011519_21240 [Marmoricola endophyticus]|uniref:glycine oxidase n=1 Tax=Marmoricola endophyticus TaxID=2040280 RepID=A0A917BJR3_9ACTN|nr:hypothetical protein GCM10011519_21240 [Marmoricola endophyticus]
MGHDRSDVLVVGLGVVGALAAWRAAELGARVTVLDPAPMAGSTYAAAGMIAPVTETEFGESDLVALNLAAAAAWPGFAAEIERRAGSAVGFSPTGVLVVAYDADDARELARLRDLQRSHDLDVTELTARQAREREPLLGPRIAAATWVPHDHQVDPRRLAVALRTIVDDCGVQLVHRAADRLLLDGDGAVTGVVDDEGREHRAGTTVLAAGAATRWLLAGLDDVDVALRPVKGQILRLDASHLPWLRGPRIVRGLVQHRPVYVVGRDDGEIVVGATSEERADTDVTAGGVFALLRDARALIPGLDEARLVDLTARSRPATPDNLARLGRTARAGLVLATGHYRHGVLQAPMTAAAFDDLFAGRDLDPLWTHAGPRPKETA